MANQNAHDVHADIATCVLVLKVKYVFLFAWHFPNIDEILTLAKASKVDVKGFVL